VFIQTCDILRPNPTSRLKVFFRLETSLGIVNGRPILVRVRRKADTPANELDSLIVRTPGTLGGRPRIRGHRVGVHRIAGWWQLGLSIEEIAEKQATLGPAEIHAALAYYHLHRAEIDGYLAEERAILAAASPIASTP
jgi:uncharacterized protein (DUF433 family)